MKIKNIILSLLLLFTTFTAIGCGEEPFVEVDYTTQFKYDETSTRNKEIVTLKNTVDGDTAHFEGSFGEFGVVKARFLGIDTPESTGKVEPWGVKASNFTKNILKTAHSIMVESSSNEWELDSTGGRYLLWIWYKAEATSDWRLLNLEILQNGYSKAKGLGETCYSEVLQKALNQAIKLKLNVHSDGQDPDYFYSDSIPLTIGELRKNIKDYEQKKVAFEGLVSRVAGQTAYVEDYDYEDEQMYGMSVYMGYTAYPFIKKGNICRIIGTVSYYEGGGTYQVSGLTYMEFRPDYKYNSKLISEGHEVIPTEITADQLTNGNNILSTNVQMNNLQVVDVYTTKNGESAGAMTLTCKTTDNKNVSVRTEVIYKDADQTVKLAEADVLGKIINVNGIVDYYDGDYQVRVFTMDDISFVE